MKMQKKWSTIIPAVMALLVLTATAVPALAQSEEGRAVRPETARRAELAIVAPRMAPVGEEVSMSVFERRTQSPVKDVAIWALTREDAETLKEKIAEIREASDNASRKLDWESVVSSLGILLGTTHGNGQLKYTFEDEGFYLLVALKEGYRPGRTGITIRTLPEALAIEAPRRASPGETVTMTVFQRGTEDPVKDAAIWALTREDAETLKERIAEIREASDNASRELDWESLVSDLGILLGTTNGSGKLRYTFEEEGFYLLLALKEGYHPGRTGIAIKTLPDALAIEAPRRASPGETVTMTVFQRGTEDPVKDAAIWALTREDAETLKERIAEIREASDNASRELDWESLVSGLGILLGTTNGSGKLRYTFEEEGFYLLLALKEDYHPGRTGIAIRGQSESRPAKIPNAARSTW